MKNLVIHGLFLIKTLVGLHKIIIDLISLSNNIRITECNILAWHIKLQSSSIRVDKVDLKILYLDYR